jgi:hypothetical protein
MAEQQAQWLKAIQEQYEPEKADEFIQNISGLLGHPSDDVLRQFASEFVLDLREIRQYVQKVEYECSPEAKAMPVFTAYADGESRPVSLAEFCQMVLERIAESRQIHDLFSFYVMALAEQQGKPAE